MPLAFSSHLINLIKFIIKYWARKAHQFKVATALKSCSIYAAVVYFN